MEVAMRIRLRRQEAFMQRTLCHLMKIVLPVLVFVVRVIPDAHAQGTTFAYAQHD